MNLISDYLIPSPDPAVFSLDLAVREIFGFFFLPVSVDHMKLQLGYVEQFQVSFLPAFNILHHNTLDLVEIFLSWKTLRDLIYAGPRLVSPSSRVKTHRFQ